MNKLVKPKLKTKNKWCAKKRLAEIELIYDPGRRDASESIIKYDFHYKIPNDITLNHLSAEVYFVAYKAVSSGAIRATIKFFIL